jgi:hypothetical protein
LLTALALPPVQYTSVIHICTFVGSLIPVTLFPYLNNNKKIKIKKDFKPQCIYIKHFFWMIYIYIYKHLTGLSKNAPNRDYSVNGSEVNRVFHAVNAVSIIVTTYACGIIPEIQV